ncbi:MAG TPA: RES family NAD+ phosphorylase [Pseudolabrys sp.]|nr:RES family NAD+ phosphorylase [Pseudolabrys sp.]
MSSSTWTLDALSSSARKAAGQCWRFVEAQHHVSTAKLTDNSDEQRRLELLIEDSKPAVPEECQHLSYLLYTPFRYRPYPMGSRFRRAGFTPGVFYASALVETAAAEMTFHRLLFFAESPDTPWPTNAAEYTGFSVAYSAARSIDLTGPAFVKRRKAWIHPTDYQACQDLSDAARAAQIDIIKYESARAPDHAINIAILTCRSFASPSEIERQTWRIYLAAYGARVMREFPRMVLEFDRMAFSNDPRIAQMKWERG